MNLFTTFIAEEAIQLVEETLRSGYINQGKRVDELEKKLESELYLRNPVTLNSCTSALKLALILSGVGRGDEVILSPQTFVGVGLVVLDIGAIPVFADVDINGNISFASVKEKINPNTRAILCVHWGGIAPDMDKIYFYVKQNWPKVAVIEDGAHALGAIYNTNAVGSCLRSDFCCFSLQSIKTFTTGDGGILCIGDNNLVDKAKRLRWFGMDKKNMHRGPTGERLCDVREVGYKMHMNDITASIGLGNLLHLNKRLLMQRHVAFEYISQLHEIRHLGLPSVNVESVPTYWFFPLRTRPEIRNEVIIELQHRGIPASTIDRRIDNHSVFAPFRSTLPGLDYYDSAQFALPSHADLSIDDIKRICDEVKDVMAQYV